MKDAHVKEFYRARPFLGPVLSRWRKRVEVVVQRALQKEMREAMFGKQAKKQIELGDVARDTITGFEGVVIAESLWLHGCRRLTLQPKALHEGKPIDSVTFDEPQLEAVVAAVAHEANRRIGGPRPEPTRR